MKRSPYKNFSLPVPIPSGSAKGSRPGKKKSYDFILYSNFRITFSEGLCNINEEICLASGPPLTFFKTKVRGGKEATKKLRNINYRA